MRKEPSYIAYEYFCDKCNCKFYYERDCMKHEYSDHTDLCKHISNLGYVYYISDDESLKTIHNIFGLDKGPFQKNIEPGWYWHGYLDVNNNGIEFGFHKLDDIIAEQEAQFKKMVEENQAVIDSLKALASKKIR